MATMLSTIANGGVYTQPRIVKQIISNTEVDENGNKKVTNIETIHGDRVISEETAKNVLSMMQTVVDEGTGKNAKVAGYSIGGKTGTSEDGVNTGKYVTSFIGTAPIEDPEVVVLITLYNPTGEGGHQGGGVAAPVGGQIFSEILPYLEVQQGNQDEIEQVEEVETPDIIGKNIKEAEKIVKENGLELIIQNETENLDKENTIIKNQTPQAGIMVNEGNKVYIEY